MILPGGSRESGPAHGGDLRYPGLASLRVEPVCAAHAGERRDPGCAFCRDPHRGSGDRRRGRDARFVAERISDWYLAQIGNASFVSLQANADTVVWPRWLPRRSTAQATISEAHFETQLEKTAKPSTGRPSDQHDGALTWQLELPPSCEVLRCTANGRAATPVARDDSSIELALTPDAESKSQVEIAYTHRSTALEPIEGSTILTLPLTPLFIHKLDWKLEIPEIFVIHAVDGNVEVSGLSSSSDGHTVLLTKSLCQGEAPRWKFSTIAAARTIPEPKHHTLLSYENQSPHYDRPDPGIDQPGLDHSRRGGRSAQRVQRPEALC